MEEETLEQYIERNTKGIIEPGVRSLAQMYIRSGAKWQSEKNKKDIENLIKIIEWYDDNSDVRPSYHTETIGKITMWDWFEQFKKK